MNTDAYRIQTLCQDFLILPHAQYTNTFVGVRCSDLSAEVITLLYSSISAIIPLQATLHCAIEQGANE